MSPRCRGPLPRFQGSHHNMLWSCHRSRYPPWAKAPAVRKGLSGRSCGRASGPDSVARDEPYIGIAKRLVTDEGITLGLSTVTVRLREFRAIRNLAPNCRLAEDAELGQVLRRQQITDVVAPHL